MILSPITDSITWFSPFPTFPPLFFPPLVMATQELLYLIRPLCKGSSVALRTHRKTHKLSLLYSYFFFSWATDCYTPYLLPRVHEWEACCVKPWGLSSPHRFALESDEFSFQVSGLIHNTVFSSVLTESNTPIILTIHNSALCLIQILQEEKAMCPSDAGCPSCLFLCIKYGGRTRNIPRNELSVVL